VRQRPRYMVAAVLEEGNDATQRLHMPSDLLQRSPHPAGELE
jgi:hypothetical protein